MIILYLYFVKESPYITPIILVLLILNSLIRAVVIAARYCLFPHRLIQKQRYEGLTMKDIMDELFIVQWSFINYEAQNKEV
jgi:hypothetical protein